MNDEATLIARWERLTIRDNYLFSKTMEFAPDLCRRLLEMILRVKITGLSWLEREKSLEERSDARGIRLDVYVEEQGRNRVFDVEMQMSNKRNLAKRIRYYQGMIDLDRLKRGQDFDTLGESYIIFICPFDFFGKGRHLYTFRETCDQDATLKLNDGTAKVFLNTKGILDDIHGDLKAFSDYVECGKVSGEFVTTLDSAVNKVKFSMETRLEYVNWQLFLEEARADAREEGREEGRAEGRTETRIALIKNLFAVGTPINFILQATGLTEAEVSKILADDAPTDSEV